ncbi:DUF1254 domain-containing protein [Haliea sp. E17]|uniref:DUF1254 domain-containing protein n=1 Tax=Haliea sp. E17 TaxID=3401576 RepID=UPI003AAEA5F8
MSLSRMAVAAMGTALCLLLPLQAARADTGVTSPLENVAEQAYIWGYPLVEAAKIRLRVTDPAYTGGSNAMLAPLNQFTHKRELADPDYRIGVGPNNDTVYSLAWVDLGAGPIVFEAPDFGARYYTFSMNLADSSAQQSLGQRTHGGQLPPVFLHGPEFTGAVPEGMVEVASSTRYLLIAGRILVRDASEYPLVNALQDQLRLRSWAQYRAGQPGPAPAPAQRPLLTDTQQQLPEELAFYAELGNVMRDWSFSEDDRRLLADMATLHLTPQAGFDPAALDAAQRAALRRGYAAGRAAVAEKSLQLGTEVNGWTVNYRGPRFGDDILLRAAVAKDQIYVAIPEEAIYPIARVDAAGEPLDGASRYRIVLDANALPPVDAFWSITLYDDAGYMVHNPIGRYSIGDRSNDLVYRDDGSIVIELATTAPPAGQQVNWLPAPEGPFYLMMRLYIPRDAILSGAWVPPPVARLGSE